MKLFKLDKLLKNLTGYIETQIELVKLDLKEQAREGLVNIFQVMLLLLLLAFVIFFLSLGMSVFLNTMFNSSFLGYLTVALLYLTTLIVLLLDKNKSVGKWIGSKIFKNNNDDVTSGNTKRKIKE